MNNEISSEIVENGIKITTYSDGSQHFEFVEDDENRQSESTQTDKSWWQKVKDRWNDSPVQPYVKVRDLSDPFGDRDDFDKGSDGKSAVEIGIRFRF